MPLSVGEAARPLVQVLVDSSAHGAPITTSLDRLGDEARAVRRRAAAQRARRLPVLLLFPLVLCILPAFVLLTVVPLLVGTFSGLTITG